MPATTEYYSPGPGRPVLVLKETRPGECCLRPCAVTWQITDSTTPLAPARQRMTRQKTGPLSRTVSRVISFTSRGSLRARPSPSAGICELVVAPRRGTNTFAGLEAASGSSCRRGRSPQRQDMGQLVEGTGSCQCSSLPLIAYFVYIHTHACKHVYMQARE